MKGYCTSRDVRLALASVSKFSEKATAAELSDEQIDDAIAEAEGTVDMYLSKRYTVPLNTTLTQATAPQPVRGMTRNIAAYLITLTHQMGKDLDESDPIRLRYAFTMEALRAVRSGEANLPEEFPGIEAESGVFVGNLYEGDLFDLQDFNLGYAGTNAQRVIPATSWGWS